MIIAMRETPTTDLGINALKQKYHLNTAIYPEVDLKKLQGHDLYIVDLEPDGKFFRQNPAEQLAKFLTEKDMGEKINNIYLLVSNVNPNHHVVAYTQQLMDSFAKNNRDITVHFAADLDYDQTVIFPPETPDGKWQFFGFSNEDIQQLSNSNKKFHPTLSLGDYKKLSSKNLIWEGTDIKDWLNDPDRKMDKNAVTLRVKS